MRTVCVRITNKNENKLSDLKYVVKLEHHNFLSLLIMSLHYLFIQIVSKNTLSRNIYSNLQHLKIKFLVMFVIKNYI